MVLALFAQSGFAAVAPVGADAAQPEFGARKVFLMLFLMLGPIKVLVPFVQMTRQSDAKFRRRLATRAILYSAAALMIAGVLGRAMLENFDISLPVLSMTGGIILFLVALQTVLQQSATIADTGVSAPEGADMRTALSPLAFPTIVAPYGIAAVIVFATLARGRHQDELVVAGLVLTILLLDWLAMLFAEQILRRVGTSLQVFGVVLSVTQIALGLQVILQSLSMMGLISPRG